MGQDPRDFTVQIRDAVTNDVAGTGVVVSAEGLVATCAHVLHDAGVNLPAADGATVSVYFPERPGRRAETRSATVAWWPRSGDDIAVLRLRDGTLPLPSEQVATVGPAAGSADHPFRSYGYRRLERYLGLRASGTIVGSIERPDRYSLLAEPVQLRSKEIDSGMSGAGILDSHRNLVVALIAQVWDPGQRAADRDTAFGVDAGLLEACPLGIPLHRGQFEHSQAFQPVAAPPGMLGLPPALGHHLADAPPATGHWVSRDDVLSQLSADWHDPEKLVVGLIGLGGEGKSALARRWVDVLASTEPDARVFWWSFDARPSSDEFFDAALSYVTGGLWGAAQAASARAAVHMLAAMLHQARYVFVLDGFEAMQHQRGDRYGSVVNPDVADLLRFFASPGHRSFCLITSRAAVHDLEPYATYQHIALEGMGSEEGRELLRNAGVWGSDGVLDRIVADWDGHALSLAVVASYLVRRFGGEAQQVAELPPPGPRAAEPHVEQILRSYDEVLSDHERDLLTALSLFRVPTTVLALAEIARVEPPQAGRTTDALEAARLIRRGPGPGDVRLHAAVRDFYGRRLALLPAAERQRLHRMAANSYLSGPLHEVSPASASGGPGDRPPTLADLSPFVEAVYHGCRAGDHQAAAALLYNEIYRGPEGLLTRALGAFDTALGLLLGFFPSQELAADPTVPDAATRRWLLHETGTCLHILGRPREGAALLARARALALSSGDRHNAAISSHNLCEAYLVLGALSDCADAARDALDLATQSGEHEDELVAHTLLATVADLFADAEEARRHFEAALALAVRWTPEPILYSLSGVRYAEFLIRSGQLEAAKQATENNLRFCLAQRWQSDVGDCRVLLGELAARNGDDKGAAQHFDAAVDVARLSARREAQAKAMLARGRWRTDKGDVGPARADLSEALQAAQASEHRITEADVRIALGRLHLREPGGVGAARGEAERALVQSEEMGYSRGSAAARAVLDDLRRG